MRTLPLLFLLACSGGDDTASPDDSAPPETGTADPGPMTVSALGATGTRACALAEDALRCWGDSRPPHIVTEDVAEGEQVAVSGDWTCWLDGTGSVRCGDATMSTEAVTDAIRIAGGSDGFCAITGLRGVTCWEAPAGTLTEVSGAVGANRLSARAGTDGWTLSQANGVLQEWAWGEAASTNAEVSGSEEIAAGLAHTCSRSTRSSVECWGSDALGQTGVADSGEVSDAQRVTPIASGALRIVGGVNHTCALLDDATISCWGDNRRGQLGRGALGAPDVGTTPEAVPGVSGVVDIAAGDNFTCAALDDARVLCWGAGTEGQLGGSVDSGVPLSVWSPTR